MPTWAIISVMPVSHPRTIIPIISVTRAINAAVSDAIKPAAIPNITHLPVGICGKSFNRAVIIFPDRSFGLRRKINESNRRKQQK